MSLDQIQDYLIDLRFDWHSISLLVSIEKFDTQWPSIEYREFMAIGHCSDIMSYELFLGEVKKIVDSKETNIFEHLDVVKFWFDTEVDLHLFLKCLLFGYFTQQIFTVNNVQRNLGSMAAMVLLFESGYNWIKYINLPSAKCSDISEWLSSFLTLIRDEQQSLLRKLDLYGVKSMLTLKEQLLLHVIENNAGIRTTAISKKLGLSRATVKRMLCMFKEKRVIEMRGVNRGTYYKIL